MVSSGTCHDLHGKESTEILKFCPGSFTVLGPRLTLFFGSLGYALYVGALWWYVFDGHF
jgi:hypothetical protein